MREDIDAKQVFVYYPEYSIITAEIARVYLHVELDTEKEYLLYDFNDIYNSAMIAEWKSVTNIADESFIAVGDKQCKRTRVTNNSSANSNTQSAFFSLVEGVGFVSEAYNKHLFYSKGCFYEGIMFDFLSYDRTSNGWTMMSCFNRLVADDGTVLYESPNTYTHLVREGVKWNCVLCYRNVWLPEKNYDCKYHIEFKGDTIIDDKTYQKCYYIFEDSANYPNDIPRAFVREDVATKQVYVLHNPEYSNDNSANESNATEVLLYDFGNITNASQTWAFWPTHYNMYYTTELVEVGKEQCVMYKLSDNISTAFDIDFIEGIGYSKGNNNGHDDRGCGDLLTPVPFISTSGYNKFPVFLNYEDFRGNIVYVAQEYNGIESVASTDKDAVNVVRYDLYGRRLSQPAQGVNIVKMSDGTTRKEMVK
jgi:hypothetical protein